MKTMNGFKILFIWMAQGLVSEIGLVKSKLRGHYEMFRDYIDTNSEYLGLCSFDRRSYLGVKWLCYKLGFKLRKVTLYSMLGH